MHAVVRTSSDLFEFVTKLDGTLNMLFLYFNFLETEALPFSLYYFPHTNPPVVSSQLQKSARFVFVLLLTGTGNVKREREQSFVATNLSVSIGTYLGLTNVVTTFNNYKT